MAEYSKEFGAAVQAALNDRPYRTVAGKAGISASYISDMVQGRVPRRDVVVALARACELSLGRANWLLDLAGYAPLTVAETLEEPPFRPDDPDELVRGSESKAEPLSPDDAAERLLASVEESVSELVYEPELSWEGIRAYEGTSDFSDNDLRIIEESMRKLIEARRRQRGLR